MPAGYLDFGSPPRLTTADTRITIEQRTPRWHRGDVAIQDALDFWSFAGAAANVIMQLAWPEVGYGVAESRVKSGSLMEHPWKRARTTTQYLAVAILGTDDERRAFREAVDGAHRQVQTTDASPVRYNAFDRELQLWVAACLFVGFEDTFQLLHGAMTDEQAEQFYRSAQPLGTTLQVTADQWPSTRADFDVYWNTACQRVAIDDHIREYLMRMVDLKIVRWPLRVTFGPLLKFLTIGSLAPVFRDAMGLSFSAADQRRFENLFVFVSFVNRFLPRFIRHGGSQVMMGDVRRRIRRKKDLI
ncbi:oxygenase MpaB family protein [Mycobacterium sp. AMU20-3851]|uniref:oxygenase MpaB family protein n=1 Tax=Mycobacterium sp. AMU20-3851 TaxID=3122055 RepID=UPI003753FA16